MFNTVSENNRPNKKKKVCKFNHVDDDCCIFKIKLRIWCMFMYFGKFHLDINLWFGTYAS